MERLHAGAEGEMVTLYHPDGERLMMTHYCLANNQPRMRAAAAGSEPKKISFAFVDAANLPSPAAGHMHALELAFQDNDHFTQTWTWREKGQERQEVFQLTRKK